MDCINIKDVQIKLKRLSDNEISYYCGNQELFVKKEITADDENNKNFAKDIKIELKLLSDDEIRYYCGNQELIVKKEITADNVNHENFSEESHIGFSNQNFKNAKVRLFLFVS